MAKKNTTAKGSVSRRQFGAAAGAAAVAAGTPGLALAKGAAQNDGVAESLVSLMTDKGSVEGFFVHPVKGKHPGVLAWREEARLGITSRQEARRLATQGFSVLVLDKDGTDAATIEADAHGAVAWLEKSAAVDEKRGVGTPQWAKDKLKPQPRY